ITWTTGSLDIADLLPADRPQGEAKDRPATGIGLGPDLAAMRLDDRSRDRQPDPHPLAFGGDERLEQLRTHLRRNARSGIGNADRDHGVARRARGDRQLAPA